MRTKSQAELVLYMTIINNGKTGCSDENVFITYYIIHKFQKRKSYCLKYKTVYDPWNTIEDYFLYMIRKKQNNLAPIYSVSTDFFLVNTF